MTHVCPGCGHSLDYHRWKDRDRSGLRRFKPCAVAYSTEEWQRNPYGEDYKVEVWDECACTEFSHAGEASRAIIRDLTNKAKLLRSLPVLEGISSEKPIWF